MMKRTILALAALFATASLAPVANAEGCSWDGCKSLNIDITVDVPNDFGFAHADGSFTANADNNSVETSGTSSATAAATDGGSGTATNNTSAGGTAGGTDGATAGGSSNSSATASGN